MSKKKRKSDYILFTGAILLAITAIFAILILIGVIKPNIFPPSGSLLDPNPLSSGLLTFLMLVILLYVGSKVLDFGLKYRKEEAEPKEDKYQEPIK